MWSKPLNPEVHSESAEAAPGGSYTFLPIERVEYGIGSASKLENILETCGATRAAIVTTRSIADRSPLLTQLREHSNRILPEVFSSARQHSPSSAVDALTRFLRQCNADAVISLGGGSVIDQTKAASLRLRQQSGRLPVHISVPTTLSAAEFSPLFGVTDERTKTKIGSNVREATPRFVILDAEFTVYTPGWLWLSSGIRALDHAVETVYAPDHQYATDVPALESIRLLWTYLKQSNDPSNLTFRQYAQLGAWFSFFGVTNITLGRSHLLGRQIGPRYDVPHGYTSAVLLPHVMRHLQSTTLARQQLIADAIQSVLPSSPALRGEDAPSAVSDFIKELDLPTNLRALEVPHSDLESLSGGDADNLAILEAAW